MTQLQAMGKAARQAAAQLAIAPADVKNAALQAIAQVMREQSTAIEQANLEDLKAAEAKQYSAAFIDRLRLTETRILAMAKSLEAIMALPDPVGKVLAAWQRPNGLRLSRVSVPIGVIAVIYESRPNVTADAAGLCLKSGNAVILRGGSESFYSAQAIMRCIEQGLVQAGLPKSVVQMIPTIDRSAVGEMLRMDQYIDVVIPRGGLSLIQRVSEESRIPVFKHLQGLCHTYIHQQADIDMAKAVVLNAKMRRPGICGATETILIDQAIIDSHLPAVVTTLLESGCEVRGDEAVVAINPAVKPATAEDWDTEYLDAIVSIKTVRDIEEAITHIQAHSSQHTDAIITADQNAAEVFLNQVDSAIVLHNASTQFADGGEFGMGAEIGIATGKLHARGPVGVEQLTTFKYQVRGSGQTRS